ncbi:MAG: type II secretion system protein GspD [Candidatus Rifleibacteriota bacterium]
MKNISKNRLVFLLLLALFLNFSNSAVFAESEKNKADKVSESEKNEDIADESAASEEDKNLDEVVGDNAEPAGNKETNDSATDNQQSEPIAAEIDGKVMTDDYHPDYLISTRYNKSKSGNITTWYLMYTRATDIFDTVKEIFDEEISSGDIKLSQNQVTNSIVIKAKDPESPIVKEILDTIVSLDFRSGQVLIEVLVVELSVSDEDLFDFELLNIVKEPFNIKNTLTTLGVDHGTISEANPLSKSDRLKVFVTTPNRMKMFLNAYKDKNKANVISSPHIVAANHREATFKIGNKVPIIESIRPSDAGPIKSFEIKDVGIELTVTPHINRGNQIDMEVFQAINALQTYDAKEGTANMSNREIKTNVSLADGETLILGGFIEERKIKIDNKIPVLSQIPLIGKAFNKRQVNEEKVELLIFITPKVLDTIEDVKVATKQKIDKTSFKDRAQELLKNMRIKRDKLPGNQFYLLERASRDWLYDYDRKDIDELVWDIPEKIDPATLNLRRTGHMPFGFGPSKRLKPPRLNTELIPSEGFIMSKEFEITEPTDLKSISLNVASNNAATVYINGVMVDQDPAMKLKDGHDFEYWNRSVEGIPTSLLNKGKNNIVVFLACDKSATDAYLDLELIGVK